MESAQKKPKSFRSLSLSLIIFSLGILAVVLLINNGLNIYFNYQKEKDIISSDQNRIALGAGNTVKSFIQDKFTLLHIVTRLNNPIELDSSKQRLILDKLLGEEPSFRQLSLINPQKKELARASRLSNSTPMHLTEIDMSILVETVSKNKDYISSVYFDQSTQEPIVIIAVPIKDVFGDLKGALLTEVNLKFMWDLVGNIKIGENGVAYVVDKQGNLLAFGDVSRVLKRENLDYLVEIKEFTDGDHDEAHLDVSKGILGSTVVSSHTTLGSPDWAVVVEVPVNEAYQSLIKEIGLSALIILISVLLGMISALYLSIKITKPIIRLTDVVKKISAGDLSLRSNIISQNEVGVLSDSFNEMTARLQNYQQGLEQKVAERTHELEEAKAAQAKQLEETERMNKLMVGRELKMIELKKKIKSLEMQSEEKIGKESTNQ